MNLVPYGWAVDRHIICAMHIKLSLHAGTEIIILLMAIITIGRDGRVYVKSGICFIMIPHTHSVLNATLQRRYNVGKRLIRNAVKNYFQIICLSL